MITVIIYIFSLLGSSIKQEEIGETCSAHGEDGKGVNVPV
jgi:hypothetical protein